MVIVFDNDEADYLQWVRSNPDGYVVNIDRARNVRNYPMVHAATHGLVSSTKIGNFTTGDYIKFCSTDLDALDRFSQSMLGCPLTRCAQCL